MAKSWSTGDDDETKSSQKFSQHKRITQITHTQNTIKDIPFKYSMKNNKNNTSKSFFQKFEWNFH